MAGAGVAEEESNKAAALYEELAPLSSEERLARLESEPRFWRPALARLLLKAASEAKDPRGAGAPGGARASDESDAPSRSPV